MTSPGTHTGSEQIATHRLAWKSSDLTTFEGATAVHSHPRHFYSYAGDRQLRDSMRQQGDTAAPATVGDSVWSVDGRMVARVTPDAGDPHRVIWTMTDVQSRTTGLVEDTGSAVNVLERFVFDQDGSFIVRKIGRR